MASFKFGDLVKAKKYKKLFGMVAVCLIALVTGVAVGKIFVDTSVVAQSVSGTYRDYQDSDSDIEALVNKSKTAMPNSNSFNAYQVFEIAQYNLYHSENFYTVMKGSVDAGSLGGIQNQITTSAKTGNTFVMNKLSPGRIVPIVDIDTNVTVLTKYEIGSSTVSLNAKGDWVSRDMDTMSATYDDATTVSYSLDEYEEKFKKLPTMPILYVVSSKTCGQGTYSAVEKDSDGNYTFDITITGDYLYAAGIYYAKDVEFSSGGLPAWQSLKITAKVDQKFNFKSIRYEDCYVMSMMSVKATVRDDFTQNIYFDLDSIPEADAFFVREVL